MASITPQEKFSQLLQAEYRRLFSYVLSLVQHLDDAQDILQDTCKTLWEKFDEYDPDRPFVSWACGIARFKVLQHLERAARRGENVNTDLAIRLSEVWEGRHAENSDERLNALRHCVEKLDAEQRRLLWSCYDGKLTVQQKAEQLGRSPASVHNSLRRIRRRLLYCIERTLARGDVS